MSFEMAVNWEPGSISALTDSLQVGVTIWQINVLAKPRFFGMYALRHWRPWISPKFGPTSEVSYPESTSDIALGEDVSCHWLDLGWFDSSFALFLCRYRQWYRPHSTLSSLTEHFFRNPSCVAGHSLVRWFKPRHIWHSMPEFVMILYIWFGVISLNFEQFSWYLCGFWPQVMHVLFGPLACCWTIVDWWWLDFKSSCLLIGSRLLTGHSFT